MRFFDFLLLLFVSRLHAQATLVFSAPNDSFDLACSRCSTIVAGLSVTKGQYSIPMNLKKPTAVNLLLWRYYDDIGKKEAYMVSEPFWTKTSQLIDALADTEMVSLHINLNWVDSTGRKNRIFMVVAGLRKQNLFQLPVTGVFDPDTYAPLRFTAIVQIIEGESLSETYDCTEGTCTINSLNTKTGAINGKFDFTANRVGMEKRGFFMNGVFRQ